MLPLWFSDTQREWSSDLYATDAEGANAVDAGGYGVCRRFIGRDEAASIGRVAESWRYDVNEYISARERALADDQEVREREAILGVSAVSRRGAFRTRPPTAPEGGLEEVEDAVRSPSFAQVPRWVTKRDGEHCGSGSWGIVLRGRYSRRCDILRGEGKALVLGVRHALRAQRSRGRHILMLTDNLSLALGVQKGRGSSPNINATCRELCALSLYANIRLHVRWIPSEHNPADAPSRLRDGVLLGGIPNPSE